MSPRRLRPLRTRLGTQPLTTRRTGAEEPKQERHPKGPSNHPGDIPGRTPNEIRPVTPTAGVSPKTRHNRAEGQGEKKQTVPHRGHGGQNPQQNRPGPKQQACPPRRDTTRRRTGGKTRKNAETTRSSDLKTPSSQASNRSLKIESSHPSQLSKTRAGPGAHPKNYFSKVIADSAPNFR